MSTKRKLFILAITVVIGNYVYQSQGHTQEVAKPVVPAEHLKTATFAGGCFWCMEPPFEKLSGVVEAESGYTGGFTENPTYEEVSHTETGHLEAVRIHYDDRLVSYNDLLEVFWRSMDPTDPGGQFTDRGTSYESAIFVADDSQRMQAEKSRTALAASDRFDKPIVTPIRDEVTFHPAEDYHQNYYKKNPIRYKFYRSGSGRDEFLANAWGQQQEYHVTTPKNGLVTNDDGSKTRIYIRPSNEEIKRRLTPLQYRVTQKSGTESAFSNKYWQNKEQGIYVDIVSGEPLFSSQDKFKSGTGWPSFSRPLVKDLVVEKTDYKLLLPRTEVRSKYGKSHLGHVFKDGPQPTGLRYCLNSAALKFVPVEKLHDEGYGEFAQQFAR